MILNGLFAVHVKGTKLFSNLGKVSEMGIWGASSSSYYNTAIMCKKFHKSVLLFEGN